MLELFQISLERPVQAVSYIQTFGMTDAGKALKHSSGLSNMAFTQHSWHD